MFMKQIMQDQVSKEIKLLLVESKSGSPLLLPLSLALKNGLKWKARDRAWYTWLSVNLSLRIYFFLCTES